MMLVKSLMIVAAAAFAFGLTSCGDIVDVDGKLMTAEQAAKGGKKGGGEEDPPEDPTSPSCQDICSMDLQSCLDAVYPACMFPRSQRAECTAEGEAACAAAYDDCVAGC